MTKLTGAWDGWTITDDVLTSPTGCVYKPSDIEPVYVSQSDLARMLGVTRYAIADRLRRGTLPPLDDNKKWRYEQIKHLLP